MKLKRFKQPIHFLASRCIKYVEYVRTMLREVTHSCKPFKLICVCFGKILPQQDSAGAARRLCQTIC